MNDMNGEKANESITSGRRNWFLLVFSVLFVLLFPALIKRPYDKEPFYRGPVRELRKENPEFVFLGNSLLGTRILESRLEHLLGGRKVYLLKEGGTYTAIWYLKFKNYLIASGVKPKAVFVFFRREELMNPTMNINRKFLASLQRVSLDEEPVFDRVINSNKTLKNKIEDATMNFYSIRVITPALLDLVESVALAPIMKKDTRFMLNRHLGAYPDMMTEKQKKEHLNQRRIFISGVNFRFDVEGKNLRKMDTSNQTIIDSEEERPSGFTDDPDKTFIPHIVQLAKDNGIQLVFVKIQTIPPADGKFKRTKQEQEYLDALQKYLEDNGALFHDFTGDPEITRDMYNDTVHIGAKDKERYTEIFYKRMHDILK